MSRLDDIKKDLEDLAPSPRMLMRCRELVALCEGYREVARTTVCDYLCLDESSCIHIEGVDDKAERIAKEKVE